MANNKNKKQKKSVDKIEFGADGAVDVAVDGAVAKKGISIKAFVALILSIVLAIGVITVGIVLLAGGGQKVSDGLLYKVVDGGYSIVGIGECEDENLVIPAYFRGGYVVAIDDNAFANCTQIKSVTFAKDCKVSSIGSKAFYNCTSLESVKISSKITIVGEEAFLNCYSLSTVTFEDTTGWGYNFPATVRQEVSANFFDNDVIVEWLTKTEIDDVESALKLYKQD